MGDVYVSLDKIGEMKNNKKRVEFRCKIGDAYMQCQIELYKDKLDSLKEKHQSIREYIKEHIESNIKGDG